MTYDHDLADRIRAIVADLRGVSEREMFGGLAFFERGKMVWGVTGDRLMVRVGAEQYDSLVKTPHVRPMDFTGRPLRGFVFVELEGLRTQNDLRTWVSRGVPAGSAKGPRAAKPGGRPRAAPAGTRRKRSG